MLDIWLRRQSPWMLPCSSLLTNDVSGLSSRKRENKKWAWCSQNGGGRNQIYGDNEKNLGKVRLLQVIIFSDIFSNCGDIYQKVSNSGAFYAAAIFLNFYPRTGITYLTETSILVKEKPKHFWRRFQMAERKHGNQWQ